MGFLRKSTRYKKNEGSASANNTEFVMRCETVLGHICFCNALMRGEKMALYTFMSVDNVMKKNDETADRRKADNRPFAFRPAISRLTKGWVKLACTAETTLCWAGPGGSVNVTEQLPGSRHKTRSPETGTTTLKLPKSYEKNGKWKVKTCLVKITTTGLVKICCNVFQTTV